MNEPVHFYLDPRITIALILLVIIDGFWRWWRRER